jgi:hypothetical protein
MWPGHDTFLRLGLLDCLIDPKALTTKHDNTIVFAQQPTGIFVLALGTSLTNDIEQADMQLVEGARIYHASQCVDHAEAAPTQECSGGEWQRAWNRAGRCRAFLKTETKCDTLVWLPLARSFATVIAYHCNSSLTRGT